MRTIGCSPNEILVRLTWSNSPQVVTSTPPLKPSRPRRVAIRRRIVPRAMGDADRFGSHHERAYRFNSMLRVPLQGRTWAGQGASSGTTRLSRQLAFSSVTGRRGTDAGFGEALPARAAPRPELLTIHHIRLPSCSLNRRSFRCVPGQPGANEIFHTKVRRAEGLIARRAIRRARQHQSRRRQREPPFLAPSVLL
jgi:hypothetical protein